MSQKILSVSVAAYNVEAFINKCLDSFVESNVIEDIEVIVTDDGSTDSTVEIVNSYAEKYKGSVVLVKQTNAGPGSTVNSGIAHATGKYFRMVDGDDWVNPTDFAVLIEKLKQTDADAVLCNHVLVDNNTFEEVPQHFDGVKIDKIIKLADIAEVINPSMHNLIVKTDIMKKHIKLFNCFYTDMQYLIFPTAYINTVVYFDLDIYMYRVSLGTQSMSVTSLQKNIAMHDSVLFSLTEFYEKYKGGTQFNRSVANYMIRLIVRMAGCQLSTYLSFKPTKEKCKELYNFFNRLENSSFEVYNNFKALKTVRVLNIAKLLYYPVSFLHRKKNKIK